jgi:electron transfer flavoprotein alpha subunit
LHTDVLDGQAGDRTIEEPEQRTHTIEDCRLERVQREATIEIPEEDLTKADVIAAGGYGLEGPSDFNLVEDLADALGGTLGASRPPVDDGWIDYDRQIGVTGAEIDPSLYIPCAISGDAYHMGSVSADHVIPINTDPDARVFDFADLGIVGKFEDYAPVLIEAIEDARDELSAKEVESV